MLLFFVSVVLHLAKLCCGCSWSRYLGIDFGHPWPKSPRKRAAMFAAAVLVAAPAPARLKESGLRS
ncbi:MAG: hypothetical protein GY782_09640, partial [Gammaproteobacteria bacterium]|nr:hypothetical protein [Gammaproteobacteria bacterium]